VRDRLIGESLSQKLARLAALPYGVDSWCDLRVCARCAGTNASGGCSKTGRCFVTLIAFTVSSLDGERKGAGIVEV
jgi:hypothetical protein